MKDFINDLSNFNINIEKQKDFTLISFYKKGFILIESDTITVKESTDDNGSYSYPVKDFNNLTLETDTHSDFVRVRVRSGGEWPTMDFNIKIKENKFNNEALSLLAFSRIINIAKKEALRLSASNKKQSAVF